MSDSNVNPVKEVDVLMILIVNFSTSLHNLLAHAGLIQSDYDLLTQEYLRPVCGWYKTWVETDDGKNLVEYLSEKKRGGQLDLQQGLSAFTQENGEVFMRFRVAQSVHLYQVAYRLLTDAQFALLDGSNEDALRRVSIALDSELNKVIASYMEKP